VIKVEKRRFSERITKIKIVGCDVTKGTRFVFANMAAESEESDFSEVLSDLGDERFEENRNEQEYGVEPYRFEPLGPGNEAEDEENEPQTAMDVERADRLGNTDW